MSHLPSAAVSVVLLLVVPSLAFATEEQCLKGRYDAAAKYASCEQKVLAKTFAAALPPDDAQFSRCRVKYTATWVKLQQKAAGSGSTCDAPRFAVSGGTVTDRLTGLQWEQKTDDASIHDKDDLYLWSAGGGAFSAADGPAFTSFLASLNSGACFAGQCDWRLPTLAELQTILLEPTVCTTSPCIDQGIFGPTAADDYWSSTTYAHALYLYQSAWYVSFLVGSVQGEYKGYSNYVRAVRGGL